VDIGVVACMARAYYLNDYVVVFDLGKMATWYGASSKVRTESTAMNGDFTCLTMFAITAREYQESANGLFFERKGDSLW